MNNFLVWCLFVILFNRQTSRDQLTLEGYLAHGLVDTDAAIRLGEVLQRPDSYLSAHSLSNVSTKENKKQNKKTPKNETKQETKNKQTKKTKQKQRTKQKPYTNKPIGVHKFNWHKAECLVENAEKNKNTFWRINKEEYYNNKRDHRENFNILENSEFVSCRNLRYCPQTTE